MGNPILETPKLSARRVILPLDLTNVLKNDTGSWRKDIQIKKFLVKLSMTSLGNDNLDIESAKTYVNWLISDRGKELINNFKKKGQQIFFFYDH